MAITRMFLDWSRPALPAVAEYLVRRYSDGATLNLDNVLLVLPGGRAARELVHLLVIGADQRSQVLFPPETCTVGSLPEYLYESHRPFADQLTQQLAWVQALKQIERARSQQFIPRLPANNDYAGWMDLGGLLQRQHRELAADSLDFAQVAHRGAALSGFEETERWIFFSQVQKNYLRLLDQLELWDRQTARLYAIEHNLCRTDKEIVLVGTIDMNVAMRHMIDQVADQVTALVHAPESLADSFDQHGCLNPDKWQDKEIGIDTDQMRVVEGPVDQARETARCLAAFDGRYRADQVVVGVLDERLVPHLLRQLEESGVSGRWVVGRAVWETGPYRLLESVARSLERDRFLDFAALVRHPDVSEWLSEQVNSRHWLIELDEYYSKHLQPRLSCWLDDSPALDSLKQVANLVYQTLDPLRGDKRKLAQWAGDVARLLSTFYGERAFDVEQPEDLYTSNALKQIRETLLLHQQIPAEIDLPLTASQAITQLLTQVCNAEIPSPRQPEQIELLGWLELPLDTAPALIVSGFNEGHVPTSVNSDLFLPNQLRQQLGLIDNRRRYARDAYALSVLNASREDLTLIAGRFTADHDPLAPSRLAFATDPETMARRALRVFSTPAGEEPARMSLNLDSTPGRSPGIVVPKPRPLPQPITAISATSFRTYMECPYRFYLRHVLSLEAVSDTDEELDGAAYGTVIHEVLKQFGRRSVRESTDPEQIDGFLQQALDELVARRLGEERLPTVEVQISQARQRLRGFARWQAQRAREGWQIVYTETSSKKPAYLQLGAQKSVALTGRIDRIDRRNDEWAILDYKTGDAAKSPRQTHRKGSEWIDLQLPLYVHLAGALGLDGPFQLGYVLLPKETEKIGESMADWDHDTLKEAHNTALDVARDIVAGKFWPPQASTGCSLCEFAAICQRHAFAPQLGGPADENGV